MSSPSIVIPRAWRSQLPTLLVFLVACIAAVYLSYLFPGSVIKGALIPLGNSAVMLRLPLFWLIPAGILLSSIMHIYDVRYSLDARGIEAIEGILWVRKRIVRINYEDIRAIESDQTIIERVLDVGTIEIGTAATGSVEVVISGIASPLHLKRLILEERDRRKSNSQNQSKGQDSMLSEASNAP